jgi:hypothetical protein
MLSESQPYELDYPPLDAPPGLARPWQFRTLIQAREPRPPTEYVIDKFLETHSLNIVYGAPGSLKSMIALDMALAVAGGQAWMPGLFPGGQGAAVKESAVIWIDMDNGQRRTDQRVDAMSKTRGLSNDAPFYYISMPTPSLIAHDIESMGILHDEIYALDARMVVIDNLGLVTGTVEENSAEMAQVMKNFRWIAEKTGAALLLLHHQRKGGAAGGRAGDALRGHSSIEASLDLALHVVRESQTNQITMRSTKTRGVDVPNAVADFFYESVPGTNDLSKAWFTAVEIRKSEYLLKQTIVSYAEGFKHGVPKSKLREMVYDDLGSEFSHTKIRAEIDHLVEVTGDLTLVEGKQGAKLIKVNGQNGFA